MFRHLAPVLASVTFCIACGGDDDGSGAPDSGPGGGGADACADCDQPQKLVLFFFDQDLKQIIRLSDEDGNGDLMGSGEATVFFDNVTSPLGVYNSQGMVALGDGELLATDNIAGDNNDDSNVVRLRDDNGDGDALDEGEASLWYTGALPGGGALTFPTALARTADGSFLMVHNLFYDEEPDMVLRLDDGNQDGDVDDDGEVTVHFDFATVDPTPAIFDLELDDAGNGYVIDILTPEDEENNASIDLIPASGSEMTEMVDSVDMFGWTSDDEWLILPGLSEDLTWNDERGELILSTVDGYSDHEPYILAFKDIDGDGTFKDPAEMRILWTSVLAEIPGFGGIRDVLWLPGGDLLLFDAGSLRIFRLVDDNDDGDYLDEGEQRVAYDVEMAAAAGHPTVEDFFTATLWTE